MRKNITLITFIFLGFTAFAQNLVVNPSFEQTSSNCGNFGGEGFFTDLSGSWSNASSNAPGDSCSSPDLFSSCNTIFGSPGPTHMPNSTLGYQYSHTGTRHAGIITHESLDEYREYIQGHTSAPLQAGVSYCVSMYVSLGNSVVYATDNMGVYFTNTPYLRDPCPGQTSSLINVTPQLNYDCAPITDTTSNWFRLQWNYVATGGEQYFTIGNFFNNANTNIVTVGNNFINPYAYYYIDDVSIIASSECCYADVPATQVVCASDAAFNLIATGGVGSSCSGTVSGTWSGTGITNANTGTFNPATAGVGTHTLTYTMSCGYTTTSTVIVSGCAALTVCQEANGDLTVTGGVGPYTWNEQVVGEDCSACLDMFPFPPCTFPTDCSVPTLEWSQYANGTTITPPGTWPIQVTDSDGGSLEIVGLAGLPLCSGGACDLEVQLISSQDACDGVENGTATVNAIGNISTVSYSWNTVPVQNGVTASSLATGEYVVTATDQQGCESTLTVVIGSGGIIANAGEDVVICKGQTTVLSASGGIGYVWDHGAGTGATVTVGPGSTTTYTVTVTGAGGCPGTDQVTVTVYDTPAVNFITESTTVCSESSSVQLFGDPSGGTFSGDGVTGNSFNPASAGVGEHIITYEYFEQQECPGTDNITITVELCTGISDIATEELNVHPNPSSGIFTVEYNGNLTGVAEFILRDMTGRSVVTTKRAELNGLRLSFDISTLANGQYLLDMVKDGKRLSTTRLTKQ
ncbi:MAG: T9SS type A sorting domain-containing protein [Flavobacteriales bacterium]|nr:T9SS type A sorting domain-containing protein [Flavobacteriales bacterium]